MSSHDAVTDAHLDPATRLSAARADLERRALLGSRVSAARQSLAAAREERAAVARRVEREAGDVERMEGGSVAALWSRPSSTSRSRPAQGCCGRWRSSAR